MNPGEKSGVKEARREGIVVLQVRQIKKSIEATMLVDVDGTIIVVLRERAIGGRG